MGSSSARSSGSSSGSQPQNSRTGSQKGGDNGVDQQSSRDGCVQERLSRAIEVPESQCDAAALALEQGAQRAQGRGAQRAARLSEQVGEGVPQVVVLGEALRAVAVRAEQLEDGLLLLVPER